MTVFSTLKQTVFCFCVNLASVSTDLKFSIWLVRLSKGWRSKNVKLIKGCWWTSQMTVLQRQVVHLKSWWMLSLYAHKCLLCTCLSLAWRVALAQLCGKPMSPLKPLAHSVLCLRANISVRETHHPQMGKKSEREKGRKTSVEPMALWSQC